MAERRYEMRLVDSFLGSPRRVRVAVHLGIEGYWSVVTVTCTGCTDIGEYGSGSEHYDRDPKLGILVGSGCHECGYSGKRRERFFEPFDHEAWERALFAPTQAEASP